ncbi:hypothetical protein N9L02_03420 [Gammaproteobacteria bacterium]|nr:hypothetical protein [Gammaproteobacteria bacterium]
MGSLNKNLENLTVNLNSIKANFSEKNSLLYKANIQNTRLKLSNQSYNNKIQNNKKLKIFFGICFFMMGALLTATGTPMTALGYTAFSFCATALVCSFLYSSYKILTSCFCSPSDDVIIYNGDKQSNDDLSSDDEPTGRDSHNMRSSCQSPSSTQDNTRSMYIASGGSNIGFFNNTKSKAPIINFLSPEAFGTMLYNKNPHYGKFAR